MIIFERYCLCVNYKPQCFNPHCVVFGFTMIQKVNFSKNKVLISITKLQSLKIVKKSLKIKICTLQQKTQKKARNR